MIEFWYSSSYELKQSGWDLNRYSEMYKIFEIPKEIHIQLKPYINRNPIIKFIMPTIKIDRFIKATNFELLKSLKI